MFPSFLSTYIQSFTLHFFPNLFVLHGSWFFPTFDLVILLPCPFYFCTKFQRDNSSVVFHPLLGVYFLLFLYETFNLFSMIWYYYSFFNSFEHHLSFPFHIQAEDTIYTSKTLFYSPFRQSLLYFLDVVLSRWTLLFFSMKSLPT